MDKPERLESWPKPVAYTETEWGHKFYGPFASNLALAIRNLYRYGSYESKPNVVIEPDDIVLDIGAHIGYFAVYAAKKAVNGHVYAFEPLPHAAMFAETNIEVNDCKNVTFSMHAIDVANGKRVMGIERPDTPDMAFFGKHNIGMRNLRYSIEIDTLTIESLMLDKGIESFDFLKMNIEGAEGVLFKHWEETRFLEKVRKLSFAYHPTICDIDYSEIKTILFDKFGFVLTEPVGNEQHQWIYGWKS